MYGERKPPLSSALDALCKFSCSTLWVCMLQFALLYCALGWHALHVDYDSVMNIQLLLATAYLCHPHAVASFFLLALGRH